MQTACVIPSPLGFVCGSPSHPTTQTQYFLQSPPPQQKLPTTPRLGRRRSARNSVQLFISSVIQYATSDQSISSSSSSSSLNNPSRLVEFKKRDMSSTTAQDCNHPQISLLSEMLQQQMVESIGNRPDSRVSSRGIRFQCDNTKSRSVLNSTTTSSRTTTPPLNNDVSGRKCLKFGDCPSVVRRNQVQQQPATILMNTNVTKTPTIVNNGNELTNTPTLLIKRKLLSPPPTKSLLATVNDDDEEEEEEEKKDNSDDEDGYLEDDEDDDQEEEEEEEEDDDDDDDEEDDDGEELIPSNLISSFNSRTRPNTKAPILLIPKVASPTSSEQEQTTATTATSSYYSTALSILTPPNNIDHPPVRKAKSLPYRVTSDDTTTSDWAHHNKENMPPLAHRRRKLGVKSIPIPKNLHSHESCHSNTHKRRHAGQNRWSDIVSKVGGADKSKEEKEEDVLWPLSI